MGRLLEIQRDYAIKDDRPDTSDHWYRQLKCLSEHPNDRRVLVRAIRDPDNGRPRDFLAVSYSFESAYKSLNKNTLNYEIHDLEDKPIEPCKTRDIVLQRVLKYAKAVGTRYFWIDRECIDQGDAEEHQAAMDSMDLVYKCSDHSVALLEIILRRGEVYLMGDLMSGERLRPSKVDSMVKMLRHVQKDRWWERAWTFQEEYLASKTLKLLIRHTAKQGEYRKTKATRIKGEVCVSATVFRKRVTKFLTDHQLQDTCKSLLDTFRRYNLVAETTEPGMGRAMSSTVFGDLERRDISKSYDFLPIAANVCGYGVRLLSDQLAKNRSHSVGLCALALYILNGEIFHNDNTISNPTIGVGLSEYLNTICFDKFRSPSKKFELSWLKMCRLQPVQLSSEGIITSGYLWYVQTKIKTNKWKWPASREGDSGGVGLARCQRDRLLDLMDELSRWGIYEGLRNKLNRYLKNDKKLQHPLKWYTDYMNTMAGIIVDAICCGRSLYVATLEESPGSFTTFSMGDDGDGCSGVDDNSGASNSQYASGEDDNQGGCGRRGDAIAIFAMGDDEVVEGKFCVFTSTSKSHHVSMTVKLAEPTSEAKLPLMIITGWINGLAFYERVRKRKDLRVRKQRDLIVSWPEAWKRWNKRTLPWDDVNDTASKSRRLH